MIFLRNKNSRQGRDDVALGILTSINAGLVNVCCVMAFFAFGTNVTGHVAVFAEEIAKGHWYQVTVVVGWMLAFLGGAFVAKFAALVTERAEARPWLGQVVAHVMQIALLAGVGYYGTHHYAETLFESEMLVGILLFAMGLQNGGVASASDGMVKTTHLTGLFTDLGVELALVARKRYRGDPMLRLKLFLHLGILFGYILGGLVGGVLYLRIGFSTFYLGCLLLGLLLAHDFAVLNRSRASALARSRARLLGRVPLAGAAEPDRDPG